ncbi:MAG: hypothetical protein RL335_1135 [Bacteroidota bacterium]
MKNFTSSPKKFNLSQILMDANFTKTSHQNNHDGVSDDGFNRQYGIQR